MEKSWYRLVIFDEVLTLLFLTSFLIIFLLLHQRLSSGLIDSGFLTEAMCAIFSFPPACHVAVPSHYLVNHLNDI